VRWRSANVQQLDIEDQCGTGWNIWRSACSAVAEIRRNYQLTPAAHSHAGNPFVPARYHLTGAEVEPEGLVAIATAIELLPIREPTSIVHRHFLPCGGRSSLALRQVLIAKTRGGLLHGGGVYAQRWTESGLAMIVAIGLAAAGDEGNEKRQRQKS
jgi:hypothetical protein